MARYVIIVGISVDVKVYVVRIVTNASLVNSVRKSKA